MGEPSLNRVLLRPIDGLDLSANAPHAVFLSDGMGHERNGAKTWNADYFMAS
jgi:hypothetical protein